MLTAPTDTRMPLRPTCTTDCSLDHLTLTILIITWTVNQEVKWSISGQRSEITVSNCQLGLCQRQRSSDDLVSGPLSVSNVKWSLVNYMCI
jgi:hypothetical protein